MAETEFEGRTEDEALQRASAALGVPVRLLDYSVIDEGSGGILGFGARSAKIRVRGATTVEVATPVAPLPAAPPGPPAIAPEAASSRGDDDDDTPGGIVGPAPEKAAKALEVAKALVEKMAMRATVEVRDDERDIVVTISEVEGSTDVADMLGGSRPPAVPSLQFLLNKIVNRFPEGRKHIVVEAPSVGVRLAERRAARPAPAAKGGAPAVPVPRVDQPPPPLPADVDPALATAARALAEKSRTLGKVFTIHPMSAADRRAVHATVTGLQGVQTVSEGDGLYRKIHIVPAVSANEREDGQGKRRRRRRRRRGGGEGGAAEGSEAGVEAEHDDHAGDAGETAAS